MGANFSCDIGRQEPIAGVRKRKGARGKGHDYDLHAAIAIQAVNMLGGVHWLHKPIPQTLRTIFWMRSYGAD